MRCAVCKECKSEALSYGPGGRSPKTIGEVVHTDLEEPFTPDVTWMKYVQVFVDEGSRDKRVIGLKTRDAATDATASYLDDMARDGVVAKCISGDGAGELGRSVKFQRMLVNKVSGGASRSQGTPTAMKSRNRLSSSSCKRQGASWYGPGWGKSIGFSQWRTPRSRPRHAPRVCAVT
ncbi:unnamed protein product, partial [Discosporangium mesarthrocarpum]